MQILKPHWIASEDRPIFALDVHPDGTRFATGGIGADSAAGRVAIWNMQPLLSTKVRCSTISSFHGLKDVL